MFSQRPPAQPPSLISADAGYHSEANLKALAKLEIDALIADNGMRQRDESFQDQGKHKQKPDPLYDKAQQSIVSKKIRLVSQPKTVFTPGSLFVVLLKTRKEMQARPGMT